MSKVSETVILVFVRNSLPGSTKSRLSRDVGVPLALRIYEWLLGVTCGALRGLPFDVAIFYSHFVAPGDIFSKNGSFLRRVQNGKELGDRMYEAFKWSFSKGYRKAVIIGSDLPDLSPGIISAAVESLGHCDVVAGPCPDGGYYLLGKRKLIPSLFRGKSYSHPGVWDDLVESVRRENLGLHVLDPLNDLDTLEDLLHLRHLIPQDLSDELSDKYPAL